MKTIIKYFLLVAVPVLFTNCSSDDDVPQTINAISQDVDDMPLEPKPDNTGLELPGYPGILKKYENGKLTYWAQYYYRPDGNLLKINYSYPESSPEFFTDSFYYNSAGKLLKIDGHDVYDFYWEGDRIVQVDRYNGMWSGRSEIHFEYNAKGQITERKETNLDFLDKEKLVYYYFDDGNLKMIEQYGDYNATGIYTLFFVTKFEGYTNDENLFWELEIIPRQVAQHHFPTAMSFKHLTETGYDKQETYSYQRDGEGRVIEKTFGRNRIVYQYYK